MIELKTPNGINVQVPETSDEDISIKSSFDDAKNAKEYFNTHGYVIFRNILRKDTCDKLRHLWDSEVKKSKQFIYRQATAKSERNVLNVNGWVMNPILNLQSLNPASFGKFRKAAVEDVLCSDSLRKAFQSVFDEPPKIVQSMYFEGNSATWEHQDSYYLDSEFVGSMSAAWVALEDITAQAGRFFICPGSHRLELVRQNKNTNIADNHDVYIKKIVDLIKEKKWKFVLQS